MNIQNQLKIRELKPGFGAEVLEIDVRQADSKTLDDLVRVFQHHGALLIRGQDMGPDDMMKFGSIFGELEDHTQDQFTLKDYPKIFLLSNRVENGRQVGAHFDGVGWHTDYSYKEEPVMSTMLYAEEVPDEGSDTILADLCAAYDALTPERKAQLDPLVLHHSYKYFMETREYGTKNITKKIEEENPDVLHPLIRTHPADERKALWVSTGTVKEIVDMPNPEGLELIDELVEFCTQDQFTYRHKWQVGDFLTWDNRCTLHTGTLFDDKKYTRHMMRLWVKGDKPY